jgi:ABC-type transporter MlaC component
MKPSFFIPALVSVGLFFAGSVSADDGASAFMEKEHTKLVAKLKEPASPAREASLAKELDALVDYNVLAKRAFGEPCPIGVANCTNHWGELSDAQKTEATDLLRQLVQKNYKKNLAKTLDYMVSFKSSSEGAAGTRVHTEAKSNTNPREAAVMVDYWVAGAAGSYQVVDIVTEGSSLTKNYYTQFHQILTNPQQGYSHLTQKLKEKIAKP